MNQLHLLLAIEDARLEKLSDQIMKSSRREYNSR